MIREWLRWSVLRALEPGMRMHLSKRCFLLWIVPVPFPFYALVFDAWHAYVYWPRVVREMSNFDPSGEAR